MSFEGEHGVQARTCIGHEQLVLPDAENITPGACQRDSQAK